MITLIMLSIGMFLISTNEGCAKTVPTELGNSTLQSFSLYGLSRGKGVPKDARNLLAKFRDLLKAAEERGDVLRVVEQRIGLEGETRICAEFSNEESTQTLFDRVQQLSQGIDLVNLKFEPCPP